VPKKLDVNIRFSRDAYIGRDACIGFTACPAPASGFADAQVHCSISSSVVPNRVIYFSSSTSSWAAIDVVRCRRFKSHSDEEGFHGKEETVDYSFEVHTVVSHNTPP
jgi:hypothetical protein